MIETMVLWFCRGNDPGSVFCSVDSDVILFVIGLISAF